MKARRSLFWSSRTPSVEDHVRVLFVNTPQAERLVRELSPKISLYTNESDALFARSSREFDVLEWVATSLLPRALPNRSLSSWPQYLAPISTVGLMVLRALLRWECTRSDVPPLTTDRILFLEAVSDLCSVRHRFDETLQRVARLATALNVRDTLTVLVSDGMTFEDALKAAEALDEVSTDEAST